MQIFYWWNDLTADEKHQNGNEKEIQRSRERGPESERAGEWERDPEIQRENPEKEHDKERDPERSERLMANSKRKQAKERQTPVN